MTQAETEYAVELRLRREARQLNNQRIEFLERILGLKFNEVPRLSVEG